MKYWHFLVSLVSRTVEGRYDYRWEYARCQNETIRAETTREKFFVQPSFPNVNNAEFDCIWKLQAPDGYRIKITWPVFHLDNCKGPTVEGQGSRVTVVDGASDAPDDEADRVDFCGYKNPPDFVSSTKDLHIMLKQELQPHGKGAKIMCGFEATKLPPSNVKRNHRLQSTQVIRPDAMVGLDEEPLIPIRRGPEANFNEAIEVEQRDDFDAHYYYDYHEERRQRQERVRLKRILDREKAQRELESTLQYRFQSMPMEDQLALIGGVVSIIILIILVTYLIVMRRKKIDVQEVAQNIANEKSSSLEKKPHK